MKGIPMKLALILLKETYAICKFEPGSVLPADFSKSQFYSVTHTPDELSFVCRQETVKDDWIEVTGTGGYLKSKARWN